MSRFRIALLLVVLVAHLRLYAVEDGEGASALGPAMALQQPDIPARKLLKDGTPHPGFERTHAGFVKIAKEGHTRLLFIGDSITEGWRRYPDLWAAAFGKYQPANFGIGWDRTQNVLWRLENGELEGMTPTVAAVLIGTNNLQADPAEGIARAIGKIASTILGHSPATKVLLLGIFPRGQHADHNPAREKLAVVNGLVAKLDDGKHVFYIDIGARFLNSDGDITREMMPEFLHLTEKGYHIWAEIIGAKLDELMR